MTEQIVAVRYRDIGCDQTEMYTAEELLHRKGVEFVIFGLLRVDTGEKVVIAQELCENGNYRGATTILRPLVVEVVPIGQWPQKKRRPRRTKAAAPAGAASAAAPQQEPAPALPNPPPHTPGPTK
jgi:hypothetical protein